MQSENETRAGEPVRWEAFEREPCHCPRCVQAGVEDRPQKRDPRGGHWLHGYDLKRLYEAEAAFWQRFNELKARKGFGGWRLGPPGSAC